MGSPSRTSKDPPISLLSFKEQSPISFSLNLGPHYNYLWLNRDTWCLLVRAQGMTTMGGYLGGGLCYGVSSE